MCPTPPEAPVTKTRSPRTSRPCTNSACQAVRPPIGRAAASTWLNRKGFGASTSAGTTAYSAATPSRSKGVSAYTSSPLPTTTPESSYEGIAGSRSTGHDSSSRVIAAACTRTSTSPESGDGVSISSTFKPSWCSRAASTPLPCPLDSGDLATAAVAGERLGDYGLRGPRLTVSTAPTGRSGHDEQG